MPTPLRRDAPFLVTTALLSAALSALYIVFYLRGGPRIIDATSYYLEARSFAAGHFTFHLDEPIASTLGRFLVRRDAPDGPQAAVIFPPGYPALLALGFLLGQPLVIGPLLAAAITFATWCLARAAEPVPPTPVASVARLAVTFSVVCAALRYHTADTMSHGLSALCFTSALAFALGAVRALDEHRSATRLGLGAGFFTGWLVSTRPVSALALVAVLVFVLAPALRKHLRASVPFFLATVVGVLPGVALLVAHQYAATGHLFASSQTAYYAVADGPSGCFRYGFGENIGCVGEHGDFVQHNLSHGYGAYAATATTLRRLKQHLFDAGNTEPFFLLVLGGFVLAWRDRRLRFLSVGVLAQILAYVPFYFDGNYPGGGARFYADVLPLEHILMALALVRLAERAANHDAGQRRIAVVLALVPLGFVLRGRSEHEALRDRDGGRPMFEASQLPSVHGPAMLFIDTDHGFNLAFDPRNRLDTNQWHVVRARGDALDVFAWQARGKPPAYRYEFPLGTKESIPRVGPYELDPNRPLVVEAENLWPPAAQKQGYALMPWPSGACVSGRRWLVVTPDRSDKPASVTLDLPASYLAGRSVTPSLGFEGPGTAMVTWLVNGDVVFTERVAANDGVSSVRCLKTAAFSVPKSVKNLSVSVEREAAPSHVVVAVDRFDVQ